MATRNKEILNIPKGSLLEKIYKKLSDGYKNMSSDPLPDFTAPEFQKETSPGVFVPDDEKIADAMKKSNDASYDNMAYLTASAIMINNVGKYLPVTGGYMDGKLEALNGFSAGINGKTVMSLEALPNGRNAVWVQEDFYIKSQHFYIDRQRVFVFDGKNLMVDLAPRNFKALLQQNFQQELKNNKKTLYEIMEAKDQSRYIQTLNLNELKASEIYCLSAESDGLPVKEICLCKVYTVNVFTWQELYSVSGGLYRRVHNGKSWSEWKGDAIPVPPTNI